MAEYIGQRNRYRMLVKWLTISAIVAAAQVAVLIFMLINPASGKFYVTTRNGDVLPVQPLSAPIVTDAYISSWAGMRVRSAFSLDFSKYGKELSQLQGSFTERGWAQFQSAVSKANIVKQLQNEKMIVTSVVTSTPVILKQGVLQGSYTWRVSVPLLVSFVSASADTKRQLNVTLLVRRVPVMDVKNGIQIDYFLAR